MAKTRPEAHINVKRLTMDDSNLPGDFYFPADALVGPLDCPSYLWLYLGILFIPLLF